MVEGDEADEELSEVEFSDEEKLAEEAELSDDELSEEAEFSDAAEETDEHEPIADVEEEIAAEPVIPERALMSGPPLGIRRADAQGMEMIDAVAGRASVFGFGEEAVLKAIRDACSSYLGDAAGRASSLTASAATPSLEVASEITDCFRQTAGQTPGLNIAWAHVCPSADEALEAAIALTRLQSPPSRYRTVALIGSDHGRTALCRTASGRPELHAGFGPMVAGFAHVPAGNVDALRSVVDDQTACILLSPIDLQDAAKSLDAEYLAAVSELCQQQDLRLLIDESRLCFGASGQAFACCSLADVAVDGIILGGGLFGGLPGGVLLGTQRLAPQPPADAVAHPLLGAVLSATLRQLIRQNSLDGVAEQSQAFARAVAETIGGFEFVRDVHVLGMTVGVETDLPAESILGAAADRGLRLDAAGETAVLLQPPLQLSTSERDALLERLADVFRAVEATAATVTA